MIQGGNKELKTRATSNLALTFVLSILIIEIVATCLIISYAYNDSRSTTLSITVIGCDHVAAISNKSSSTLVVQNLHTGYMKFPINSRVTLNATPPQNGLVFGWYVRGSEENQSNQGNGYLLTLEGNSSVGVACG